MERTDRTGAHNKIQTIRFLFFFLRSGVCILLVRCPLPPYKSRLLTEFRKLSSNTPPLYTGQVARKSTFFFFEHLNEPRSTRTCKRGSRFFFLNVTKLFFLNSLILKEDTIYLNRIKKKILDILGCYASP